MRSPYQLGHKLAQLEEQPLEHDQQFVSVVEAIRSLLSKNDVPGKRRIGFKAEES